MMKLVISCIQQVITLVFTPLERCMLGKRGQPQPSLDSVAIQKTMLTVNIKSSLLLKHYGPFYCCLFTHQQASIIRLTMLGFSYELQQCKNP